MNSQHDLENRKFTSSARKKIEGGVSNVAGPWILWWTGTYVEKENSAMTSEDSRASQMPPSHKISKHGLFLLTANTVLKY